MPMAVLVARQSASVRMLIAINPENSYDFCDQSPARLAVHREFLRSFCDAEATTRTILTKTKLSQSSAMRGTSIGRLAVTSLWSRRTLILATSGLAVSRATAALGLEARRSAMIDPFALGVASGDPSQDGFVLWTRLTANGQPLDAPAVPVTYEIAQDQTFRLIVRRGKVAASPALAHAVHVEVAGLEAGRPYWYRFHALGATSAVGRAVTSPVRASSARLAVTSCQHFEMGWFSPYRDVVAAQPDLIVQLGDYIYENSYANQPKVRTFGAPEPMDLDGYRRRHALYKSDPDLRAAHAVAPWVVTWDDHEVENDYADLANLKALDPTVFAQRRAAAYQAYFEHMPVRPSLWARPNGPRLYRHLAWGDLFSLPVLDGRQYRSNQACNPPRQSGNKARAACSEIDAPDRTMLGQAQEAWLSSRLTAETRPWTLLAQQTVVARLETPEGVMADQWDGYGAARDRLIADLRRPSVRNPVVLSGDIHSFWVNDLKADFKDTASPVVGTEIVAACLAGSRTPHARFGDAGARNPHVRYSELDHSGYALLDVTPKALQVDLRASDDQTVAGAPVRSLSRFVVESGQPGAKSA
jgi:alkaline phosphatase D